MGILTHISVPLWQGAERRGTETAPCSLREGGLEAILSRYFDVRYVAMPACTASVDTDDKYGQIAAYLTQLKQVVADNMENSLPFVVGGDHALGLASVAAAAERYEDLAVIWFDAHGDMNTEATSHTGHIHGMPLAAAMGLCQSALNEVAVRPMNPQHIFWIGARSLDEGEKALIERLKLHVYSSQTIREQGMQAVMRQVQKEMTRMDIRHLHCSIDVDAMDPSIVAATGVKEADGLHDDDYQQFIQSLTQLPVELTSIDFVEYNPLLDDEEHHSRQWCINAINQLMKAISA